MRAVVVGASSGLGRCIAGHLGQNGDDVALLARRKDQLDEAAREAGASSFAVACDVTDADSISTAIDEAVTTLGGIDAVVYAAGVGALSRIEDVDPETWRWMFDTNVIGASTLTAAVLPHLKASGGRAAYLTSVQSGHTPPWPGLGSYAVSKAALDKLIEAWRMEHPAVGFTRIVVGECGGGEGPSQSGFSAGWDRDLAGEVAPIWMERKFMSGTLLDVDELLKVVHTVLQIGGCTAVPSVTVVPRPPA